MFERRDGLRLAMEAVRELFGRGLDGNDAIQTGVARSVDFAPAACAERREDLIGSEYTTGGKWQSSI